MSQNSNNPLDFITGNTTSGNNTPTAQKLGGIDFKWIAVNPTPEEYQKLFEMKGFRIGDTYPEYIRETDYGKYVTIQLFVEERDPSNPAYPIRDNIRFNIYKDTETSKNGNIQVIDGLRNKSYVSLDANGNFLPSEKQLELEILNLETLTSTRKIKEVDLLEFLLIVTGMYSRNSKIKRDNQKLLQAYDLAILDDPTLEAPVLDEMFSPARLRPNQDTFDRIFDESLSTEEQNDAYQEVVNFYRDLCERVQSFDNSVKIARGMGRGNDGKVYPVLYTGKFGLPGSNTGEYSTASPIVKDIVNQKKYALSQGKDFPYFPEKLEIEDWSGDDSLLGGKPNTGAAKPGNPAGPGRAPLRPNTPPLRNPNLK